jgi:predicted RNA-binding Zn-ribbon protein involved in translation (DUF1610 family)
MQSLIEEGRKALSSFQPGEVPTDSVIITPEERVDLIVSPLREVLVENFGIQSQKSKVIVGRERINFACPYCGDSQENQRKKRGNIFINSLSFHCYNCGTHRTLNSFLKDFGKLSNGWTKINQLAIDSISNFTSHKSVDSEKVLDALFDSGITSHLFEREHLKKKLGLVEVEGTKMQVYLEKRMQRDFKKFLWDPKTNKLFILNLKGEDGLIGWQVRNFGKYTDNGSKYLTYKWSKACGELGIDPAVPNVDILDKLSYTFNIFNVDFTRPITVFEGPLDSFLFPNSIALASLHTKIPFESESFRYLFDNDKPGQEMSFEFLKDGKTVFLWKNFLKDNDIMINRSKIDWTDVMVYCRINGKKISNISKYFTDNKYDVIYI